MILNVVDLSKFYTNKDESTCIFKQLNFSVEKGERVVIYGESGSGKTTLLHILAGLEKPDNGQVFLQGKDIYSLKDKKLSRMRNEKIGMIFQEFHLDENLTVLQNVLLPRYVSRKWKKNDEKKALALLEEVGILEKADVKARYLSGGQKQRVAIARALINTPDIILADEPTANLDKKTGKEVSDLLWEIQRKKGITIILVTHENGSLHYDRKFVLKEGKLV